jgi:hypothetical protein
MNRKQFTKALGRLLVDMEMKGEEPILDYVKRSDEKQRLLFEKHLSQCDGIRKRSAHQSGCAADIYFPDADGNLVAPKRGWEYWHTRWNELSGGNAQAIIDWDKGHFE